MPEHEFEARRAPGTSVKAAGTTVKAKPTSQPAYVPSSSIGGRVMARHAGESREQVRNRVHDFLTQRAMIDSAVAPELHVDATLPQGPARV